MPRISTKSMRVQEGDINETFEVVVFYTTGEGFYAEVPDRVTDMFDQLTDKQMKEHGASRKYARKYATTNEPHKKIVVAESEDQVITNLRKLVMLLFSMNLEKTQVIIVEFDHTLPDKDCHSTDDLRKVALDFSAVYCTRVKTAGGKPRYYREEPYETIGGKKEIHRREISIGWNEDHAIIPDTPENRVFLEDLHKALVALTKQLKKFTSSDSAMLGIIANRQKLLTV